MKPARLLLPCLVMFALCSQAQNVDYELLRKQAANDTVAKVLNYADNFDIHEQKYPNDAFRPFWYAGDKKNCIYRKIEWDHATAKTVHKELNLNSFNYNTLTFRSYTLTYPIARSVLVVETMLDGRPIFRTEQADPEYLTKGWRIIYTKYCKGSTKEF
jgi:hypothetical protein